MSSEKIAAAPSAARPVAALDCAEETCRAHQVKGSDDKTVRSADHFKVIGAEILFDQKARSNNVVLVGTPASKRIPMAPLQQLSPLASPELLRHDWQETGLQFLCIDGSYVAFWMKFFVLEKSLRNVPMRLCI
jgi:hypothetical protein